MSPSLDFKLGRAIAAIAVEADTTTELVEARLIELLGGNTVAPQRKARAKVRYFVEGAKPTKRTRATPAAMAERLVLIKKLAKTMTPAQIIAATHLNRNVVYATLSRYRIKTEGARKAGATALASYWAKMTPKQRSEEMRRRLAVRMAKGEQSG